MGPGRLHRHDGFTEPVPDGRVSVETAIHEVAQKLAAVRDTHGGDTILHYDGGGQGNHLGGAYSSATRRALGSVYRSNALAQEKTGEMWVNGRMRGTMVRGEFEHAVVVDERTGKRIDVRKLRVSMR